MTEFDLSEYIEEQDEETMAEFDLDESEKEWIYAKHVKEFIRLLKEKINKLPEFGYNYIPRTAVKTVIDKLAGDKLT